MADYVFVATGAPSALAGAERLVGTMGAIVVVGMPATGVSRATSTRVRSPPATSGFSARRWGPR